MLLSLISISSALLLTAGTVSAKGTLGFSLGTKLGDGSCKYQADYEADFDAIKAASGSTIVRGYSASDCNHAQYVLPAAKAKGFQVVLGIWPDVDSSFNADKLAISTYAPNYISQVYAITVGSETLYRGNFTGPQLLSKIREVKNMFPNTRVGTADSWNKYADGTADAVISGGVDILLCNAFGFWQAQPVENATHTYLDDIMQAFGHIQSLNSKVEIWTGETGWPSNGGTNYGPAIAGTSNAALYFKQGVCAMVKWGYNVFFFEAFDEPWKPASIGDNGLAADETHWGAMTVGRETKYPLQC